MGKVVVGISIVFAAFCILVSPSAPWALALQVGDEITFYDREGTTGGEEFGVALAETSSHHGNVELFQTFSFQTPGFLDFDWDGFEFISISNPNGTSYLDHASAFNIVLATGRIDLGAGTWAEDTLIQVPEPGTLLLLGTGLVGLALGLRRRKK